MGLFGPVVSLDRVLTSSGFRESSPTAQNGFIPPEFCFVAPFGTKQSRLSPQRPEGADVVQSPAPNKSLFWAGTGSACRAARGAVGGAYAPHSALSRLIRPGHQRPSGCRQTLRDAVRPADRRHWAASQQSAAVLGR